MRKDGRVSTQGRPVRITPHYLQYPLGSVLMETGETKVICSVSVEDNLPGWLRNARPPRGWLTAEYSMLPGATQSRTRRDRGHVGGRTQEIQRLIGRSLRGVIDLGKCPDMTFMIDCDVVQADGGTRTASITGAYVALKLAVDKLLRAGKLKQNPLTDAVAAVSVGLKGEDILVDLDYDEDSSADMDLNLVMTPGTKILEIQGTAERSPLSRMQIMNMIEAAEEGLQPVFELQQVAADGQVAES